MRISIGAYVWGGEMMTCLVWSFGLVQAIEYIASSYLLFLRKFNFANIDNRLIVH